jgi:two-component system response regulator
MTQMLVIEDNTDDIEMMRRVLEKIGVTEQVRVARDGAEALEYLFGDNGSARPEVLSSLRLILLDLDLPKVPGLRVLYQIKTHASTRHIPVVILTVSRKEPDLIQGFMMGISDYLIKPPNPDRLAEIYRKYVGAVAA